MPASSVLRHALIASVAAAGLGQIAAGLSHVVLSADAARAGLGGWPVALGLLAALGLCAHAFLGEGEEAGPRRVRPGGSRAHHAASGPARGAPPRLSRRSRAG